jgi:histidine triad (HIT) family protein
MSDKNNDCIFCKIAQKILPAKIIRENDNVIVIQDISPKAPVHYLIMPKKHISDIQTLKDKELWWSLLDIIQALSFEVLEGKGFNLISNNGKDAGQSVQHLHFHFLSGKNLYEGGLTL